MSPQTHIAHGVDSSVLGNTLRDLLNQRRITIDEALSWAMAIAAQLTAFHQAGQVHGGVTVERVWIERDKAGLLEASGTAASASQPRDIAQFAALLRRMLDNVQTGADGLAQWRALDRIAETNLFAEPGSRMDKVAWAIQLVRLARRGEMMRRTGAAARTETSGGAGETQGRPIALVPAAGLSSAALDFPGGVGLGAKNPTAKPLAPLPAPTVVSAVKPPPAVGHAPGSPVPAAGVRLAPGEAAGARTYDAGTVHFWACLASAAAVAVLGCILLVRAKS